MPLGNLQISADLLICTACGAQYDTVLPGNHAAFTCTEFIQADESPLKSCRICDDPRQFVPPAGQSFTTLKRMIESGAPKDHNNDTDHPKGYRNVFRRRADDSKIVEMWTEPKFGIGQRACIIQSPHGNVMWDMVAYLDEDTVNEINNLGGLEFIVISHPHFYTTWADWANTFQCNVYMASVDAEAWANRTVVNSQKSKSLALLTAEHTELLPGLTAIIAGGHFPGSMVLHSAPPNTDIPTLFAADTIMAVPSAHNPDLKYHQSGTGIISYSFMWSIPNMIPLHPDQILKIWHALRDPRFEFRRSYSVFAGGVVSALDGEAGLRRRVLESMKIFVRKGGWVDHALWHEDLP